MHKIAMEMGKWAMEQAKAHGFDNLTSQQWDDLKDCMEIVKSAICADKDYREVEAMDDFEKEYGRMGYRGRAANGRFVHRSGRGRSTGYTPYLHMMDDVMDEYDMYDDIPYPMTGYRMGYTGGKDMSSMDGHSSDRLHWKDGMHDDDASMRRTSRYGESYDRYKDNRRHYTENPTPEYQKMMKDSADEVFDDIESLAKKMYEDADAQDRAKLKTKMTQLVQNMK